MEPVPSTQTKLQAREDTKKNALIFIAVVAILIGTIFVSLLQLQPPKVVPATGSANEFSAERALSHLKEFAVKPHPLGSVEHDRVRDYLVHSLEELGLNPEIQKANSLNSIGRWIVGGTVENIVAKIEGTTSTKAIMLVAHYDSEPGSPGAADDGAGVAAILETVRALKEMAPLQNDVIILLTDGEENGLLGAKAFVEGHPWVNDVGLVLNFEARGNEGPSFMFETSDNNSWLVKEFVQGTYTPVAHSFLYSLYKQMPNDTDFSVFKEAGLKGLNFAFGDGVSHYHTTSDNFQELSLESLQHHGEYMLHLVTHFGNVDLTQTHEGNQVFFNILGSNMITYSDKLVIPIMLLAVILFAVTAVHGYWLKKLSLLGTFAGFLVFIIGIIGSFAIGSGLWSVLTFIFTDQEWLMGTDKTVGTLYFISFSIIIFAFLTILYGLAHKKIKAGSLMMGALFLWLILLAASSFLLQAGSYVFAWPLLFALICVNILIRLDEHSWKSYLVTAGFAIPAFLILSPVIYLFEGLISMHMAGVLMVLVSLLGAMLVSIFTTLKIKFNWVIPSIFLVTGLLVMITNSINLNNMPTAEHPQASDIAYFMDADSNKAYWAARQPLDEYTSNYINENVKKGHTSEFFPILNWDASYTQADLYSMEAPSVTVLSDKVEGAKRTIEYQLKTNRNAEELLMESFSTMNVSQLIINGKEVELKQKEFTKESPFEFNYVLGQAEELHVKVTVNAKDSIEWMIADRSYSIPESKGERSSKYSTYGDNSYIMKTIKH
ncbi:hypothetical protein BACCIP111899_03030 [Bacillus rhizoplanae]|uniref:Vacuolar membrane protease n=1 Tax=Bacillus rhizoplanae TaxID=2880966 RepID=A0ABM8YDE8_9BACI|nr:hypothetical protein BACCIP111899_03030 [Bacillus rhizoplanae]